MSAQTIILLRAHLDNAYTRRQLADIRLKVSVHDVKVVSFNNETPSSGGIYSGAFVTNEAIIRTLPYKVRLSKFNPIHTNGYNDLPVMSFFLRNPQYDFYWILEYDVRYTGKWDNIFRELSSSKADLLGTTVQRKDDNPDWCHWEGLSMNGKEVPNEHCVKSFTPFIRLSNSALKAIHELYRKGLDGHFEATWASACSLAGLSIEDLGGDGPFTNQRWRGKHYRNSPLSPSLSPGTFQCYPLREADLDLTETDIEPMLWHAVKS